MSRSEPINRRQFIRRSAVGGTAVGLGLGAGEAPARPIAPSDKMTLAMIAVGARAQEILDAAMTLTDVEVVGVCDAYSGRVERAVARTQGRAKAYKDYREILADRSVDSVVIASPDHLHAAMCVEALRAGKDVYIEKPMTYTVEEGHAIIEEAKKSRRIVQVGSQGMSSRAQQKAREMIAAGKLGRVTMIRASYNRNTAGGAWIYPIPPDASPSTVNWEMFLGSAPKRPVDYARFFRWRCYRDYSGGIATDLFVHLVTTIHFVMNAKMPSRVVAMGELYRWKESRDVPDTLNAILEYPEGFTVSLGSTFNNQYSSEGNFQILGTEGTLLLGGGLTFLPEHVTEDNRWVVRSWPQALEEAYYRDPKVRASEMPATREPELVGREENYRQVGLEDTVVHLRNFAASVRTRKQPVQDALAGHRAASVAHMVNRSVAEKKMVAWDFSKETISAS